MNQRSAKGGNYKLCRLLAAILLPLLPCSLLSLSAQTIHFENNIKSKLKTFSVIGDSYSTFLGKTEPVDNAQYYPIEGLDVYEPAQTWWRLFSRATGIQLQQNNSYSGGTICNTWWNGDDASAVSFVKRVQNLRQAGLIIVEGGTNDSNAGSPIGSYVYADWTAQDLKAFRPATAWVLNYLRQTYPDAMVVFMLNNGMKADINTSVAEICKHYDVPLYTLSSVTKANEHPTYLGMQTISNQLIAFVNKEMGYITVNETQTNTFSTDVSQADLYVQLTFRADEWTVMCLPFALDDRLTRQLFGDDAVVAAFEGVDGDQLLFTTVDRMEASVPYIVRPSRPSTEAFCIDDIDLPATTASTQTMGDIQLRGYYRTTSLRPSNTTSRMLSADGDVVVPADAVTLNAFRGWFSVPKTAGDFYITVDRQPIHTP